MKTLALIVNLPKFVLVLLETILVIMDLTFMATTKPTHQERKTGDCFYLLFMKLT